MNTFLVKSINILTLLASLSIIVILSFEALSDNKAFSPEFILNFQLTICLVFLVDFFIRMSYKQSKLKYFFRNIVLLIISIPYINLLHWIDVTTTYDQHLILRTLPLIRGVYGLAIVISWLTNNKIYTLFFSYLITLIGVTYYSSVMFFAIEKGVNPMVTTYWNALWWALMDVTTVGSNIYGTTTLGQLLAAMLAGAGMMLFPIFTAYITTIYSKKYGSKNQQR